VTAIAGIGRWGLVSGVAFALLFIALVLLPSGLFGQRGARRT